MAKTIAILEENALKAYNEADEKGKALLINLIGKDVLNAKITDRVKTFEDVLAIKGISQNKFDNSCAYATEDEKAYKQIKLIAEVLNEGWTPDWSDSSQYKYYPYFDLSSGLSFGDCSYNLRGSGVGSRLCFKSAELANYAGTQFLSIYKAFLTIQK